MVIQGCNHAKKNTNTSITKQKVQKYCKNSNKIVNLTTPDITCHKFSFILVVVCCYRRYTYT